MEYWHRLAMPTFGAEEIAEAMDSLGKFRTTMGEKVRRFEKLFAEDQGCADAVMVNSGSSAVLLLNFLLINPPNPRIERGAEILAPIVTWPSQIWSSMMAGFKMRFVDVDPNTLNIDIADLERKVTPQTRAISLVHLLGNPCLMDRVLDVAEKNDLLIMEDCCEAHGSSWDGVRVGNFGIGGAFSFYFSHHMTTMEGGMIACPNTATADELRILRAHGWERDISKDVGGDIDPRYTFTNWGFNFRPMEVQGAFGIHQMAKLSKFASQRAILAENFFNFIEDTPTLYCPQVSPRAEPSWLALPVMVKEEAPFGRDDLTKFLEHEGVETRPIVAGNLAKQPVARNLFAGSFAGDYPGADRVHDYGFYLGLSPMHTLPDMDRLFLTFWRFLRQW